MFKIIVLIHIYFELYVCSYEEYPFIASISAVGDICELFVIEITEEGVPV